MRPLGPYQSTHLRAAIVRLKISEARLREIGIEPIDTEKMIRRLEARLAREKPKT